MTTTDPIVPPPEQVDQWFDDAVRLNSTPKYYIATQAAQWGADQELEACVEWVSIQLNCTYQEHLVPHLRAARRPKPPTLKEQALNVIKSKRPNQVFSGEEQDTIRRALEALND